MNVGSVLQVLLHLALLQRTRDIPNCPIDSIEGDEHPEHVEEDQIHPQIHEVASVEVDVAGKPLGAEGHES